MPKIDWSDMPYKEEWPVGEYIQTGGFYSPKDERHNRYPTVISRGEIIDVSVLPYDFFFFFIRREVKSEEDKENLKDNGKSLVLKRKDCDALENW